MNEFTAALHHGLSAERRAMSPRWFYDERGSELFERICELPEYYPTRTEMGLLARHAEDIAERIGPGAALVDFGAGSLDKARLLLRALRAPAAYWPIDISGEYLQRNAAELDRAFPELPVRPVVADFTRPFDLPDGVAPERRVGFYPGSSIGNLLPDEARAWLRAMGERLRGGMLVGVDLIKDPERLHAAYNDAAGVTAEFNLNLWARANREAEADFDLDAWAHAAFYNAPLHRIEMHLVSRRRQRVHLDGGQFDFGEGDSVHTECSYKYSLEGFGELARAAGWQVAAVWTDPERLFSLHWLEWRGA